MVDRSINRNTITTINCLPREMAETVREGMPMDGSTLAEIIRPALDIGMCARECERPINFKRLYAIRAKHEVRKERSLTSTPICHSQAPIQDKGRDWPVGSFRR